MFNFEGGWGGEGGGVQNTFSVTDPRDDVSVEADQDEDSRVIMNRDPQLKAAHEKDQESKRKRKEEFDKKKGIKEKKIQIGDKVLIEQKQKLIRWSELKERGYRLGMRKR